MPPALLFLALRGWGLALFLSLGLWSGLAQAQSGPLEPFEFAPNPGELSAYVYIPDKLADQPALVVALHGCAQEAKDFDDETGWTTMADQVGFILLLPEQRTSNNPFRCFNWFNSVDRHRNKGEAESIRHMIDALLAQYSIDRNRIFVTGLSAGGGMTSVMLATHPDYFSAGAVLSGVPYGCAATAFQAMPCMEWGNRLVMSPSGWAKKVWRAAPSGTERWPRVAIWHDEGDTVVNPYNAGSSMEQWTAVHGIDQTPDSEEWVGPHQRRVYADDAGTSQVEWWLTRRVGHATPIDSETGCGFDDPSNDNDFVADVDLCATRHIARFWGLLER